MAVSVIMPEKKPQQDPMELILKGLQIAGGIYGIKEAQAKLGQIDQENAYKAAQLENINRENQVKANEAEGVFNPKQFAEFQEKGQRLGTPGVDEGVIVTDNEGYHHALMPKLEGMRTPEKGPYKDRKTGINYEGLRDQTGRIIEDPAHDTMLPGQDKEKTADEKLSPEVQKAANSLAEQTAGQINIANNLKNDIAKFDKFLAEGNEDQAVVVGENMVKTLNSVVGKDAVSKDEANRLVGFLTYHKGNLTEPGPIFGRDLDAFRTQVGSKLDSLGKSIQDNSNFVEQIKSGKLDLSSFKDTPKDIQNGKKDSSGQALAAPSQKDPLKMTDDERKAELKRLRGE